MKSIFEDLSEIRKCHKCLGTGKLWSTPPKIWAYKSREPIVVPRIVNCDVCGGVGKIAINQFKVSMVN